MKSKFFTSYSQVLLMLVISGFLVFIILGCSEDDDEFSYERIYVESLNAPDSIHVGEVLKIEISGYFPSPAYTFHHFDVQIRDRVIEITPIAKFYHLHNPVPGKAISFERAYKIKNLKLGSYEVKVVGRPETISTYVTVNK